jgi:acetyl-CoA synthetase
LAILAAAICLAKSWWLVQHMKCRSRVNYLKMRKFWAKHGKRIDWFKPFTKVKNTSFKGKVSIKWFEDGITNVSYNCVDRHLKKRGDQVAIIWEGDNPYDDKKITYKELYEQVCRLSNVMKSNGVKKGDRVTIYMPMIPEAAYAMLACARIGAVHSIVFGGFSPDALAGRIEDCESTFVITADEGLRGGKKIPLKHNTDKAIEIAPSDGVSRSRRCWWSSGPPARSTGMRAGISGTTRRWRRRSRTASRPR